MKCINCGNELNVTWKYCRNCGCPVASRNQQSVSGPKKTGRRIIIGLIVSVLICAILFVITACYTVGKESISDNSITLYSEQIEKKNPHPLSKHSQYLYVSDRLVTNVVMEFDDRGLLKKYVYDTSADFSYQFDSKGNPERIHVFVDNGDKYTIDLMNTYYGQEITEVRITGDFEKDKYANALPSLIANYVGYANATLCVENTDAQIRIADGKTVYSSGNYGYLIEMSYIYQRDGGRMEITKSTAPDGSYTRETNTYNTKGQLIERKDEQIDVNQNKSYQIYYFSYNSVTSPENGKTMTYGRITKADYSDENERSRDDLPSNYSIIYTYGKQGILESCEISIEFLDYVAKNEYDINGNVVHTETRTGDYLNVDDYQYF